jgi:hypothetical protein
VNKTYPPKKEKVIHNIKKNQLTCEDRQELCQNDTLSAGGGQITEVRKRRG